MYLTFVGSSTLARRCASGVVFAVVGERADAEDHVERHAADDDAADVELDDIGGDLVVLVAAVAFERPEVDVAGVEVAAATWLPET